MKLSISNIAWPAEQEDAALALIRARGIDALEVAPTRLWPNWEGASVAAAIQAAHELRDRGFRVSSLQAILFGKPQYRLLGTPSDRASLLDHLKLCADLASGLGADALVFGAPKNRALCGRAPAEAFDIARDFFHDAAALFEPAGLRLCLEPNPTQYACEFLTSSPEAARLVRAVDSPGIRLHLDSGCMQLAEEDPASAIRAAADVLSHFHVSEPFLGTFEEPAIDHRLFRAALEEAGYVGWVTLEMRAAGDPLAALAQAIDVLVGSYAPAEVAG